MSVDKYVPAVDSEAVNLLDLSPNGYFSLQTSPSSFQMSFSHL